MSRHSHVANVQHTCINHAVGQTTRDKYRRRNETANFCPCDRKINQRRVYTIQFTPHGHWNETDNNSKNRTFSTTQHAAQQTRQLNGMSINKLVRKKETYAFTIPQTTEWCRPCKRVLQYATPLWRQSLNEYRTAEASYSAKYHTYRPTATATDGAWACMRYVYCVRPNWWRCETRFMTSRETQMDSRPLASSRSLEILKSHDCGSSGLGKQTNIRQTI